MKEIWRDIEGYEGLYQVSNLGNVKSFKWKGRLLKPVYNKDGYAVVDLCKDSKVKGFKVHRLVANSFPEICGEWFDGCEVDHVNTIRDDDRACNLKVCTRKENCNNPITKQNMSKAFSKAVMQFTLDGEFVATYKSARHVERTLGYHHSNICNCCNGRSKSSYGFTWKYA